MFKQRGTTSVLLLYVSIISVLFLGTIFGIARLVEGPAEKIESRRAKSLLDERIAIAQEIRAALARPLLPMPPLPPITAKLANPNGSKAVVQSAFDMPNRKISPEARNSMAQVIEPQFVPQTFIEPTYVPRTYIPRTYTVPERGSPGGW
jgi:hypothetical protein